MRKFPKVRYPGDAETDGILAGDIVVTEKIDGANCRVQVKPESGEIILGTRNTIQAEKMGDGEYKSLPIEDTNRSFRRSLEFLYDTLPLTDDRLEGLTLFGESMQLHSLEYEDIDWKKPPYGGHAVPTNYPYFYLFDIYDEKNSQWLHWDEVVKFAEEMNLPLVEVLERGDPDELSLEVPEESIFGGPPEGIVVRRIDGTVRAKKVTDDFKEENAMAFDDPKKAQSDAAEFVAMYITRPRIEKMAHRLVEDGEFDSIKMEMMPQMPRKVLQDAMAENGWDLFTNPFECEFDEDFKAEVRSKTSRKCARVLKEMVNEF